MHSHLRRERVAEGDGRGLTDPERALDLTMMARCIEVARIGGTQGEFPFGAVICRGGDIIVETTNQVLRSADVTRHAELVALSEAQKVLGQTILNECTLYSVVEPCPMCSFPILANSHQPGSIRHWVPVHGWIFQVERARGRPDL